MRTRADSPVAIVLTLGATQNLAWASSYYLPAVLARPIARDLGLPDISVYAAFSFALVVSAFLGPAVGRAIDRSGGRGVLCLSNFVLATGLVVLAVANDASLLALAWAVLGVGMALGLYDSAFATLAGLYGPRARASITGVTLIGGFASTVGWPVTSALAEAIGWRGTCLAWAAVNILVALPLNRLLIPPAPPPPHHPSIQAVPRDAPVAQSNAMLLLAFVFAASGAVAVGTAAVLPRVLQAAGVAPAAAIAAAALFGPAQVGARLIEFGAGRNLHPLISARIAMLLHPLGAAALLMIGAPAASVLPVLHGAGNGLVTIARGTLPLALFGPAGYGVRTGVLAAPTRIAQAAAPLAFGLLLDRYGTGVLYLSSGLGLASFLGLLMLHPAAPVAAKG